MISGLICLVVAIVLFIAAFIAKRHFGLLGLALATGSLLSGIWAYDAGMVASFFGMPNNEFVSVITAMVITVLPAIVLLFHGYTYRTSIGRVCGAILFSLLAVTFLVEPLSSIINPSGIGKVVINWLIDNKSLIIGSELIAAVVDIFLTKPVGASKKR